MRSSVEREQVAKLIAAGLNDCQIERESGIPRPTVSDWRHGRRGPGPSARAISTCPMCADAPERLPTASYAYLLGAYLGDGHIVRLARGVHRLTIYCSLLHINVAWWIARATEDVIGRRVPMRPDPIENVLYVQSHWKHWPCLFPQHGPGRKHERSIVLADWQRRIVDGHPDQLLRGLIHSDGSRFINRVRHPKRTYEYVRYEFTNHSDDIKRIFCDTCDALSIEWRVMNRQSISVARRDSVARLDEFIGPKR